MGGVFGAHRLLIAGGLRSPPTLRGQEEPVPRRRMRGEIAPAGKLLPRQSDLFQPLQSKAGAFEAIMDLSRLPEMLLETLKAKFAEGEIITGMVVVMGGVLSGGVERLSQVQGAVHQQHGEIVDGVHGRHYAEECAAGLEAGANLAQGSVELAGIGHDQAVHRDRGFENSMQWLQVSQWSVKELYVGASGDICSRARQHAFGKIDGPDSLESPG